MTEGTLGLLVLVAAVIALYVAADRARTIAVCDIERGKVTVTRGRLSPRVLGELRDIASRARIPHAKLVVRKENGAPALLLSGIDDERTAQQLRNTIGRFKIAELRS